MKARINQSNDEAVKELTAGYINRWAKALMNQWVDEPMNQWAQKSQ